MKGETSMIKIYTGYNNSTGVHYYNMFNEIRKVPKIGEFFIDGIVTEINSVKTDCEQGNDDAYKYDCYEITTINEDEEDEEEKEHTHLCASYPAEYDYDQYAGEINKKLFEAFGKNEIFKSCEDEEDFYEKVVEITPLFGGSNSEYCYTIYKIFGIEKLNEILKEYNYFYDEVSGNLDYIA